MVPKLKKKEETKVMNGRRCKCPCGFPKILPHKAESSIKFGCQQLVSFRDVQARDTKKKL